MIIKHIFQIIGIVHLFTGVWHSLIVDFHGLSMFLKFESLLCKGLKQIKQMKYLPVKTLQEIYFKTTIPSLIYCILIWGNCSTALFSSLESTHLREVRIIFNLDCLLNSHWPSVSYFHKKYVLVFMHKVYFNSLSFWPDELYLKKVSGKPLRAINQIFTPRPRSEVRRNSLIR